MSDILQVEGISQSFGGHRAVDEVSFTVEEGAITSLIGPNGAGKTTVFNMISGILSTESGDMRFRDQSIRGLLPFEIARRGIGRTFQDPRVFPEMSVLDNMMVGMRQRGESPLWALLRGERVNREWRAVRERAEATLESVGLHSRAHDKAKDLSFGEQRFLSIARTLMASPYLVIMDEPTVGLDRSALAKLTGLMASLVETQKATLLVIEHNMDVVMSVSKKIVLLVGGKVVASDSPEEIRKHRNMVEAYLGRKHVAAGH